MSLRRSPQREDIPLRLSPLCNRMHAGIAGGGMYGIVGRNLRCGLQIRPVGNAAFPPRLRKSSGALVQRSAATLPRTPSTALPERKIDVPHGFNLEKAVDSHKDTKKSLSCRVRTICQKGFDMNQNESLLSFVLFVALCDIRGL